MWKITILRQQIIFISIAEGGAKVFGVFRVKNHDFTPKNHIFSNFRGGGRRVCLPLDPPLQVVGWLCKRAPLIIIMKDFNINRLNLKRFSQWENDGIDILLLNQIDENKMWNQDNNGHINKKRIWSFLLNLTLYFDLDTSTRPRKRYNNGSSQDLPATLKQQARRIKNTEIYPRHTISSSKENGLDTCMFWCFMKNHTCTSFFPKHWRETLNTYTYYKTKLLIQIWKK